MSLCSLASHFQVHAAKGTNEDGSGTLSYQDAALSFVYLWAALSLLAIPLTLAMSAAAFRIYYWRPTYDTWKLKSNPKYPAPTTVRREKQTNTGLWSALHALPGGCAPPLSARQT